MSTEAKTAADREYLVQAKSKGLYSTLIAYFRLSGPGWLQSAITLGGGSLGGSLYLGIVAGFTLMWLQPLAMVLGIIMLSAIGYVTMSTGKRPFRAINQHVNPVLGWSWALASLAANMVWCLPQYSLANGVLQQNLFPSLLGESSALGEYKGKIVISLAILVITTLVTWSYGSGSRGVKIYELFLKIIVAVMVLSFGGVVVALTMSKDGLAWREIWQGFIPNWRQLFDPSQKFQDLLAKVSADPKDPVRAFWTTKIVSMQRDVMISAAATAVGINMTFLFPYSLLKKGWTKEFRGLATFDLFTGMLIPFMLATSCVVIAAASRFHANVQLDEKNNPILSETLTKKYEGLMKDRKKEHEGELGEEQQKAEKQIAASLVKRDAFDLARALEPLTDKTVANVIFGIGVLGMTLSTISILMLISGFVLCEIANVEPKGWVFRIGTLFAATGALGPFVWSDAAFYLVVPTSVFGMSLLPIAYLTFFMLLNQKKLLGDELPTGPKRWLMNAFTALAALVALATSVWVILNKAGYRGFLGVVGLLFLAIAIPPRRPTEESEPREQ